MLTKFFASLRKAAPASTDSNCGTEAVTRPVDPAIRDTATRLFAALGGKANVSKLKAIAHTRLRVELAEGGKFDEAAAISAGALAMMKVDARTFHLIVGSQAEQLAAAMS